MTIYSGFTHWKWWFSIVMLVYQRVDHRLFLESPRAWDDLIWFDHEECHIPFLFPLYLGDPCCRSVHHPPITPVTKKHLHSSVWFLKKKTWTPKRWTRFTKKKHIFPVIGEWSVVVKTKAITIYYNITMIIAIYINIYIYIDIPKSQWYCDYCVILGWLTP